jgi:hypothetical protein
LARKLREVWRGKKKKDKGMRKRTRKSERLAKVGECEGVAGRV